MQLHMNTGFYMSLLSEGGPKEKFYFNFQALGIQN